MMRYPSVTAILLLVLGCARAEAPQSVEVVLLRVRYITAAHLEIPLDRVKAARTFRPLGADALDIVEITMATEDQLGISIRDDALNAKAGGDSWETLADRLTLKAFADVAAKSEKEEPARASELKVPKVLNEGEVGRYSELMVKSNPRGLLLVFIPSLADLIRLTSERIERELTAQESETVRQRAIVIALPADAAGPVIQK